MIVTVNLKGNVIGGGRSPGIESVTAMLGGSGIGSVDRRGWGRSGVTEAGSESGNGKTARLTGHSHTHARDPETGCQTVRILPDAMPHHGPQNTQVLPAAAPGPAAACPAAGPKGVPP